MVDPMNRYQSVSTGSQNTVVAGRSLLVFITKVIGAALSFSIMTILARLFGPKIYGEFRLIHSAIAVISPLTVLGLDIGLTKFVAQARARGDRAALRTVLTTAGLVAGCLACVWAVIIYGLRIPIASAIFHKPYLAAGLGVGALLIVPLTLLNILKGVSNGCKQPHLWTANTLITVGGVFIAAMLGLAFTGQRSSVALIAAYTLANGIAAAILLKSLSLLGLPSLRRSHQPDDARIRGVFMRFSLTMCLVGLLGTVLGKIDTLMLGMFLSADMVGIYSVGFRLCVLSGIFVTSIGAIYTGVIAEMHMTNRMDAIRRLAASVAKWQSTLTFPLLAILMVFPSSILSVFGSRYREGAVCLCLLAIGRIFSILTAQCSPLLAMCGRERALFFNNAIMILLNVLLNILFIPRYGITGAALATMITRLIVAVLRVVEVRLFFGFFPFSRVLPLLFMFLMVMVTTYGARSLWNHALSAFIVAALCTVTCIYFSLRTRIQWRGNIIKQLLMQEDEEDMDVE